MAAGFDGFQGKPISVSCWRRFRGSWGNHEHLAVISWCTFLGVLALALLAAPPAAGAQQAAKVPRIGVLIVARPRHAAHEPVPPLDRLPGPA
jgi:hypothetical protein